MTSRERIRAIISGKGADRCGFWLGNPHGDMWPILHEYFGTSSEEELRLMLGDDFRWTMPVNAYKHPEERGLYAVARDGVKLGVGGVFANCEDAAEVDQYEWANPDYLDFTETIKALDRAGDHYRASSFWSPFFHLVADYFGMENYFLKMYTNIEAMARAATAG